MIRLAAVTLLAGVLIAVAVLDTVPSAACDKADEHKAAQRLKLAEDTYSAVLKDDPASACARAGLELTQCERAARAHRRAGLFAEARKRYLAILIEHPRSECAREGLTVLGTLRCEDAHALLDEGLYDEAVKAYTALLELEPRPDCVPGDLKTAQDMKKAAEDPPETTPASRTTCCCRDRCEQRPEGGCDH